MCSNTLLRQARLPTWRSNAEHQHAGDQPGYPIKLASRDDPAGWRKHG